MSTLFLNIARFIGFALLIPIIIAVTQAFNAEMSGLKLFHHKAFHVGILTYVFSYFFIYNFEPVYDYGRNVMSQIFNLFGGRFENIGHVIPVYTVILLIVYYILSSMGRMSMSYGVLTSFGIAFTFTMHVVMTASHFYEEDSVPFKPGYAFKMALTYILNVCLLALLFALVYKGFSAVDFLSDAAHLAERLYRMMWNQLF